MRKYTLKNQDIILTLDFKILKILSHDHTKSQPMSSQTTSLI